METFLVHWGYAAVFLLGFLGACCVPIPSAITFGLAGALAGEGQLSIVGVILVGTVAELIGSLVSYTVGGQVAGHSCIGSVATCSSPARTSTGRNASWQGGAGGRSRLGASCRWCARSYPLWRASSRCPRCCSGS